MKRNSLIFPPSIIDLFFVGNLIYQQNIFLAGFSSFHLSQLLFSFYKISSFSIELYDQIPGTGLNLEEIIGGLDECGSREWRTFSGDQKKFAGKCWAETIDGAVGYLSCIRRIRFRKGGGGKIQEFRGILKSPNPKYVAEVNFLGTKEEMDSLLPLLVQFHNREVDFYSELVPKFLGQFASEFLPHAFAWQKTTNLDGLEKAYLLLEDLTERGKSPEEADNLSKEQVESLLLAIGRLHALSLTIPPKQIDKLKLGETHLFKYPAEKVIQRLCENENGEKEDAEYFQANREEFEKFIAKVLKMNEALKRRDICEEYGIRPVLTHGDLWSSNLLFQNKNPNKLAAILDWQFTRPDTGLNDLAHLLLGSVEIELRKENQQKWIGMYREEMKKWTKMLGEEMPIETDEEAEIIFQKHLPKEIYFLMQMFVLNEEAGEPLDKAKRRKHRLVEMFKEYKKTVEFYKK